MSQLIQMNQRINAIDTIKKITHATRLIAMSSHTRLVHKEPLLSTFKHEVHQLFSTVAELEDWQTRYLNLGTQDNRTLLIVVGSQKGFCGTFNIGLFKFFEINYPILSKTTDIITVGKKAQDYIQKKIGAPLETFNNLSSTTITNITDVLATFIINNAATYKDIIVLSNTPKTFFTQKPIKTTMLPMQSTTTQTNSLDDYIWHEDRETLISTLMRLYLASTIESLLFSSLVAEQASRFHSMDNATRNAKDLLEIMRRDYNKLRQAKITKELLELTGSFERR
jgi:F-type H+-transporting ATPase subunit gamma